MRRVGLFGGTFDPPHVGHLVVAQWALERLRLDRIVFMPSGAPPHKRGRPVTPAADRVAMIRLAVRGNRAFVVSTLEAGRPGSSYTVDTLRTLRARHPGTRLFLLIGEDSLAQFHTWREPESILELATLAVAPRGGRLGRLLPRREHGRQASGGSAITARNPVWLDSPLVLVSSSQLRRRSRLGRSLRYLVPEPVAAYIVRHRLYRGKP